MYNALDSAIMGGVNKGVHAWNWTTGKTKAELANILDSGYGICFSVGICELFPIGGILIFPLCLLGCHTTQENNTIMEKLERNALENGCLDSRVECYKGERRIVGGINAIGGVFGFAIAANYKNPDDKNFMNYVGTFMVGSGFLMEAASNYVMRADYFPPRKNCVRRGLDKLSEIVESYRPQPTLAPIIEAKDWQKHMK